MILKEREKVGDNFNYKENIELCLLLFEEEVFII